MLNRRPTQWKIPWVCTLPTNMLQQLYAHKTVNGFVFEGLDVKIYIYITDDAVGSFGGVTLGFGKPRSRVKPQ